MRRGFAKDEKIISIFFYMETAYDKTWRYEIMRDLHSAGLRGKMPSFINEILPNRVFQVRLQQRCSSERIQETGVAQGSTISVILFAIKINSLSKVPKRDPRINVCG